MFCRLRKHLGVYITESNSNDNKISMTLIFSLQVCRDVEKSTWICRLIKLITAP